MFSLSNMKLLLNLIITPVAPLLNQRFNRNVLFLRTLWCLN